MDRESAKTNTDATGIKRTAWYRMDNSSQLYAATASDSFSSMYRITAVMNSRVRKDLLQRAVDLVMPRFPMFGVTLKKGLFWPYFQTNSEPGPFVKEDTEHICLPIRRRDDGGFLTRIYYYENQITVEAFHAVADGVGIITFHKTLVAQYLRLIGYDIPVGDGIFDTEEEPDPEELSDAYDDYATSPAKKIFFDDRAYTSRGRREPVYTLHLICGIIPVEKLIEVSKRYGASVTEYMIAQLIAVLDEKQRRENPGRLKKIKINMSINLRMFHKTRSLRNFIFPVRPYIDPSLGEYTFEEIVERVRSYMRFAVNDKEIRAMVTRNVKAAKNRILRLIPFFIKEAALRSIYLMSGDNRYSLSFSNVGNIPIPDEMKSGLDRIFTVIGSGFVPRPNCAVASCNGKMTVSFASNVRDTTVEREFFRRLIKDGIPVLIESNRA